MPLYKKMQAGVGSSDREKGRHIDVGLNRQSLMSFLTDPKLFDDAKTHWDNEMRLSAGYSVSPWLDCPFRVITDDVCANVYSCIADTSRRGILITQWLPDAEVAELDAWIDTFGDPSYPNEHVEYLRVHSKQFMTASIAVRALAKAWLFDALPRKDVEELITELVA
jgi:hypothetical protein